MHAGAALRGVTACAGSRASRLASCANAFRVRSLDRMGHREPGNSNTKIKTFPRKPVYPSSSARARGSPAGSRAWSCRRRRARLYRLRSCTRTAAPRCASPRSSPAALPRPSCARRWTCCARACKVSDRARQRLLARALGRRGADECIATDVSHRSERRRHFILPVAHAARTGAPAAARGCRQGARGARLRASAHTYTAAG